MFEYGAGPRHPAAAEMVRRRIGQLQRRTSPRTILTGFLDADAALGQGLVASRGILAVPAAALHWVLMSGHSRPWMRLARLIVACLAFVLARPAPSVPGVFEDVVLVADVHASAEAPSATEETRSIASRALSRQTSTAQDVSPDDVRDLAPLQSPRALIARKYLRHCSLLC